MSCPGKVDYKLKCMSVIRIRLKSSSPPEIYAKSLKKQVVRGHENGLLKQRPIDEAVWYFWKSVV